MAEDKIKYLETPNPVELSPEEQIEKLKKVNGQLQEKIVELEEDIRKGIKITKSKESLLVEKTQKIFYLMGAGLTEKNARKAYDSVSKELRLFYEKNANIT